jgi:glycosyltransferase involved in cell wall biosynthesis
MKVLILNKRAPFEGRGAEQVIWRIGKRFADEGHQVRFFCPSPTAGRSPPEVSGVDFDFIDTSADPTRSMIEFFLKGPLQYRSTYKEFQPDVVYDNPSPFPFHAAHLIGESPLVNKVHAVYRRYAFACKDHPLVKVGTILGEDSYRLYRGEYFITNSESTATRLERLVNTQENELIANPIGIDAKEFEMCIPEDAKRVVSISKLSPRKRINDLLRAWDLVETEHPAATLSIAGSGPLDDQLQKLRRELNLSNVTFEGFVSESRKHELLSSASVSAAPTLYEGFGVSVLEAMASGCAVVTSDTWGVKDFVQDGQNGLTVPPKSPREFASALNRLFETPANRSRIARAARNTAEEYSMATSLDRELEYLESVSKSTSLTAST